MSTIFADTKNTRPILENSLKYIRSDVPTVLPEQEKSWMLEHDITTIIDLRTNEERAKKECPLETDLRFNYYCFPVTGGNTVPTDVADVSKSYIRMVDTALYKTIDFMMSTESNVLYFCNAGKDRTGVVSAILLHRTGASEQYIVDDYMKSKVNLNDMLIAFAQQNPSINIEVITPHERYIKEFLDWFIKTNR